MLPAEFSACFHPLEEGAGRQRLYFQRGEGYAAISLGFVIRIDILEVLIQLLCEGAEVCRWFFKFYEPFVSSSGIPGKENGRDRIVPHDSTMPGTS